jgi:hypothetical protein
MICWSITSLVENGGLYGSTNLHDINWPPESFIYNRFENEPSRNLFSDPDRINHDIYLSMRRKGWGELDGIKNNATPAMLNIMQHHPVSVDYFELRD